MMPGMMMPGMMPGMMAGGFGGRGGLTGRGGIRGGRGGNMPTGGTAYLSLAMVPPEAPLSEIFTLCEVYGKVMHIRRNFTKPKIVTVRYYAMNQAAIAALCIKATPFHGTEIYGRVYDRWEDRAAEPTEEGDPSDPSVRSYHFGSAKHRGPNGWSRAPPSEVLIVRGFGDASKTAEDVHQGFADLGFTPNGVEVSNDGDAYLALFDSTEVGVKALIACHGKLCGDEDSIIIFGRSRIAPAKPTPIDGDSANEVSSAHQEAAAGGQDAPAEAEQGTTAVAED
jgi:hypothetical protein